jgi:DNA-binding SARP family transcriptional activator/WD40 repeat protein/tRNA A-37 threonylcarbamoyl transferase component Bud32
MGFAVLGSLVVDGGAGAIEIGGARVRRLLAVLLVHANEVVSEDRLLDLVWEGTEPAGGTGTLRVTVSRLRKVLEHGGSGGARLVTRAPGYALEVTDDELDAARFERLVGEGRSLAASGDDADAVAVLDRALALWRGPAFAEFADEDWARPVSVRLEERRIEALVARAEAKLAAGRHAEVVGDLAEAVEVHPTRERLRGLRILALYRSGRQAEALREFQAYRSFIGEELGLEPSPELVRLEARVVANDPGLQAPTVGRRLRGYHLIEPIGLGASSTVHRATQPGFDREVAVKVIPAERARDPEFVRRFEADVSAVACLEHPHVVPVIDHWRDPEGAYVVMRLLRGGDANTRARQGPMSNAEVRRVVGEIGGALAVAHARGIVHGDLGPGDVLFDDLGHAYLGDLGRSAGTEGAAGNGGGDGGSGWCPPERHAGGGQTAAGDQYALGRLVELLATGGDAARSVDVAPPLAAAIRRATAVDPMDRFPDVAAFVEAVVAAGHAPGAGIGTHGGTTGVVRPKNPYRGLRPFTEADASEFFGRDHLVATLVERLARPGAAGRFQAVVGPSGSGKSSVVRAGLVPAVRRGAIPGSARWFVASMVPGRDPYAELVTALQRVAVNPTTSLLDAIADDNALERAIDRVLPDDGSELLLVVDQFEELFTLVEDDDVRRRFLDALVAAVTDPRGRLRVVITLRADFYDRPLRVPGLAELLEAHQVTVAPLAPSEVAQAVTGPASTVGLTVEPDLVTTIVADVAEHPAALPLLQYALAELFDRADGKTLTLDAYWSIGGVAGALAQRADAIVQRAEPPVAHAIRSVLGRLVTLGEGTADTRKRVPRAELLAIGADPAAVATGIDRLGAARLLAFDRDPQTREPTVEIAHEALLTRWPRLQSWIEEDRDGLRLLQHLGSAAHAWDDLGRPPEELYRGARLDLASDWADTHPRSLTDLEATFVAAGRAARDAARAEEHERVERQARQNRRLRQLLVGVAVAMVIALVAGVVAVNQRDRANDQRDRAEAQERTARARALAGQALAMEDDDLGQALRIALAGYRTDDSVETRNALLAAVTAAGPIERTVRFGDGVAMTAVDDRATRAAVLGDGDVQIWDLVAGRPSGSPLTVGPDVTALVFDDGAHRLGVGYASGQLEVWDVERSEPVAGPMHAVDRSAVRTLAFSDDGAHVAVGGVFAWDKIVDLRDGTRMEAPNTNVAFQTHAMTSRGSTFYIGSEFGEFRTVSADLVVKSTFTANAVDTTGIAWDFVDLAINDIAVSRDGQHAVTGHGGPLVTLWDLEGPAQTGTVLPGAHRPSTSVAISDDGRWIAAVSTDGSTLVWQADRPDVAPFELPTGWFGTGGPGFGGVAFDDRDRLVIVGVDGARTFDLQRPTSGATTAAPFGTDGITDLAFAPDGRLVAVTTATDRIEGAGRLAVWDPRGEGDTLVTPLATRGWSLAVDPRGRYAAVTGLAERFEIVDLASGAVRDVPTPTLTTNGVAFTPDGGRLAVSAPTSIAGPLLWYSVPAFERLDVPSPDLPPAKSLGFDRTGTAMVVSPSGGPWGNIPASVVDVASGTLTAFGDAGGATSAALAPDGHRLYVGRSDGVIRVLDVAEPDRTLPSLVAQSAEVVDLAVSADGTTLASISRDGGLVLWDVATSRQVGPARRAPAPFGSAPAPAVTVAVAPDGRTAAVGYADGQVVVWDLDPEAWARTACSLMAPASAATVPAGLTDDELCPPTEEPAKTLSIRGAWARDVQRSIANATLLAPAEYSPFVVEDPTNAGMRFDADAAAAVSGCGAELDAVFETERHGAITATKKLSSGTQSFYIFQYVAVLPDERAAAAMAALLTDPVFRAQCLLPYGEGLAPGGIGPRPRPPHVGYIPFHGVPCEEPNPQFPSVGNASSVACFDRTFVDELGASFPWGRFDVATIQVGRTVVLVEIAREIFGRQVSTDEDVAGIMARVAERADRALRDAGER